MRDYLNVTMLPDHYGWVMEKKKKKKKKKKNSI